MLIRNNLAMIGSLQFGISGPFDCNIYALKGPQGTVLIDCGAGSHTDELIENLQGAFGHSAVDTLLITHCHLDHCGAASAIQERTGCQIIAPNETASALQIADEEQLGFASLRRRGMYPMIPAVKPCRIHSKLSDGSHFTAAGMTFEAVRIQGHSKDSYCLITTTYNGKWIFTGDSIFYGGTLGVINHPDSHMADYQRDLPKLRGLKADGLFPGHGLFTLRHASRHLTLAIEQSQQNFLPRQIGQGDLIF